MRFIHTADLHLDTPFDGIKNDSETPTSLWQTLKDAPYQAFQKIVDQAIQKQVDFMLIVGDIFDSKNQSVKSLNFFIKQMRRLDDAHIPVMLSFGNHDFQPETKLAFDFPKNVFVFPKQVTTHQLQLRDGTNVAITGFSYPTQAITTDIVATFPLKAEVDYQIGMVHGEVGKSGEDNYAPFTISEMKSKGYDYWALGHIHKRGELSKIPMIEYPGDIQGRHKNESGEKGCLLVDNDTGNLTKAFLTTSASIFTPMTIKVDSTMDITAIVNHILQVLKNSDFDQLNLLNLTLESETGDFSEEVNQGMINDLLIHSLQRALVSQYQAIKGWVYEIKLKTKVTKNFSNLDQDFWDEAKKQVFSKTNLTKLAGKLFVDDFIRDNFNNEAALDELAQKSEAVIKTESKGVEDNDEN